MIMGTSFMSKNKKWNQLIAARCLTKISGYDAKIDGMAVMDREFNGYKRTLAKWNHCYHVIDGFYPCDGTHTIIIGGEYQWITDDELKKGYDFPDYWVRPDGSHTINPPDYCGDLNAMRTAELELTSQEFVGYMSRLAWIVVPDYDRYTQPYEEKRGFLVARPEQKAEAWLLALKLIDVDRPV